jgi:hypothetical protein
MTIHDTLKQTFGFETFLPGQEEVLHWLENTTES